MYNGPIYACEFEQSKMTPVRLKVTVDKPGTNVGPIRPEIRTQGEKDRKPPLILGKEKKSGKSKKL
jgi:hypothetical protein